MANALALHSWALVFVLLLLKSQLSQDLFQCDLEHCQDWLLDCASHGLRWYADSRQWWSWNHLQLCGVQLPRWQVKIYFTSRSMKTSTTGWSTTRMLEGPMEAPLATRTPKPSLRKLFWDVLEIEKKTRKKTNWANSKWIWSPLFWKNLHAVT